MGTGEVEIAAALAKRQLGLSTELQLLFGCSWG